MDKVTSNWGWILLILIILGGIIWYLYNQNQSAAASSASSSAAPATSSTTTTSTSTATTTPSTTTTSSGAPISPTAGTSMSMPTQIVWSWNPSAGATGYDVNNANDPTSVTDNGANTSYIQTGLTPNTSYTFYVWAYNANGTSSVLIMTQSTTQANTTNVGGVPATPTAGTNISDATDITWNWNPSSGANGYAVNNANDPTSVTDNGSNTSYTQSGLTPNTQYTFYVWAYNSSGASTVLVLTQSTTTTGTVTPPVTPTNPAPSAPTAGTNTSDATDVTWNWNPVAGATGYYVNNANDLTSVTDNGSSTTYTQSNLTPNTNYTFFVWAYNAGVTSPVLIMTQMTTAASTPTPVITPVNSTLSAPIAGTSVPSSTQIVWNWNPPIGIVKVAGYAVSQTNNPSSGIDILSGTSYTQTGLTPSTAYTLYVWAYDANGNFSPVLTLTQSTTA